MNTYPPRPTRLGLVLRADDLAAIDRHAAREEVSRASWARRVLRQKLRELAASTGTTA